MSVKNKFDIWLFRILISVVLLAFILMEIYTCIKPTGQWLIDVSIILMLLCRLLLMIIPAIKIYQERGMIKYFFSMPLSASIEQNIKNNL